MNTKSFDSIVWSTDWRPGYYVELVRPAISFKEGFWLSTILAIGFAIVCLCFLPIKDNYLYSTTAIYSLLVFVISGIWLTGNSPGAKICFNWDEKGVDIQIGIRKRHLLFSDISQLTYSYMPEEKTKLLKMQQVCASTVKGGVIILFEGTDHGSCSQKIDPNEFAALIEELAKALNVPFQTRKIAIDTVWQWHNLDERDYDMQKAYEHSFDLNQELMGRFDNFGYASEVAHPWKTIFIQSPKWQQIFFAVLMGWCFMESYWFKSNGYLAVPLAVMYLLLVIIAPVREGAFLGLRLVIKGQKFKAACYGWIGILVGSSLIFLALELSNWTPDLFLAVSSFTTASVGIFIILFGLGLIFRQTFWEPTNFGSS